MDNILLQTENYSKVKTFIKSNGIKFVRWINSHSGHELAKTNDGKFVEIMLTHRDNNPMNVIYNIVLSSLTK